uniref:Uncharacterized protein n=1 Tax=Setaria viridis TaxID=4556 RepID=A0A4U6VF57_SETVI|nr:hypothetical protein SEVIR_3G245250v2 [Setaria viridis]
MGTGWCQSSALDNATGDAGGPRRTESAREANGTEKGRIADFLQRHGQPPGRDG